MSAYYVLFSTNIELTVEIEAENADLAADEAWAIAEGYLATLTGDGRFDGARVIFVDASLDGIGACDVRDAAGVRR